MSILSGQLDTIENLSKIARILAREHSELLPTVLELMMVEIQELVETHCIVKEEKWHLMKRKCKRKEKRWEVNNE